MALTRLAQALAADLATAGEGRARYAKRRGISRDALDAMLDGGEESALSNLLAQEIEARLEAEREWFLPPRLDVQAGNKPRGARRRQLG